MTSVQRTRILNADLSLYRSDIVSRFQSKSSGDEIVRPVEGALKRGCTVAVCTYKRAADIKRFLDSLMEQDRKPDQLIIVDASPDTETEQMVKNHQAVESLAKCLLYFRVTGALRGLTRQRNFALRWVATDSVVFFDDDIVLFKDCLSEMERTYRSLDKEVVGVGAYVQNHYPRPPFLWRLRRRLRIVSSLTPGIYCRSGIAIPWGLLGPTEACVEAEWLSGCAMMWKTIVAREVGFNELFSIASGYSNGEDLEFSLKMATRGKLVVAGRARVWHLHDVHQGSNWSNAYQLAYTGIHNAYYIHRHCLVDRTWKDAAWFVYAQALDTLIRGASLIRPGSTFQKWLFLQGRLHFFAQLLGLRQKGSRQLWLFQSVKNSDC